MISTFLATKKTNPVGCAVIVGAGDIVGCELGANDGAEDGATLG
jgi:hypothetical protein